MVAPVETRRRAMEEIRTADRLIGSAMGTFQSLGREQVLDMLGRGTDGFFNENDSRDNAAAIRDLIEAEGTFRRALELLGRKDAPDFGAEHWAFSQDVIGKVFDIIQMMRANENFSRANEIHRHLVAVFEALRSSDPALHDVPPLSDWGTPLEDAVDAAVRYNPAVRLEIGFAALAGIGGAVLFVGWGVGVLLGWFEPPKLPSGPEHPPHEKPSVPEPQHQELTPSERPAMLACEASTRDCLSTCGRLDVCHAFSADLDGDETPEWILAGYDHPGPDALGARPFSASTIEVFRSAHEGHVRIGAPLTIQAEALPNAVILARRSYGLQPFCVRAAAYDIDGNLREDLHCFELERESWRRAD